MMHYLQLDETALNRAGALWTAREIAQQPESWIRTQALLRQHAAPIAGFLAPLLAQPELRIILTGAGSSAFIGECLAPLLMQQLGRRVEAIPTTDLLSGPHQYFQPDVPTLLVSFGRSGSSPESVAVVDLAERLLRECHQLVFTCNEQGTLYQRCRERRNSLAILLPPETHDQSFAMTSSFTAMMLAASLVFHPLENAAAEVARIARGAQQVLERHSATLRKLAVESYSRVVYLGSNGFKGLAREAALKLLELTDGKVVGAFDSPLGFRHGPKTIVTGDTLLFVFMSNDPYTRRYDLDLLRELRSDALAGRVIAVTAQINDAVTDGEHLHVPHLADSPDADLYYPYIVCGQLYAFHRSLSVGNTPDQPSNSGTVSRVVSGVTIHTL
ncbi:MAG: SIS domain-containing protein [Steroidobacteraceae bacterium]